MMNQEPVSHADLKTGILHLGLGAFHRAHQADFTQDAIVSGGGDWGIEAVSMRDPLLADAVNNRNDFRLLIKGPQGIEYKQISAIRKAYCLATNPELVINRIAATNIHLITITVTEKGYGLDRTTGRLNLQDPVIRHDLENPAKPKGLTGVITEGLRKRRDSDGRGITLLSCDNLPSNGKLLQQLVLEFAGLRDEMLARWIETNCTFPCSMVDRITPAATPNTHRLIKEQFGFDDPLAVETEPFRQWVIEDNFAGPRPAWEKAGVIFVKDVELFELMKLRMLNGAHSLIAYMGTFLEFPAVRDVMAQAELSVIVCQHMAMAADTLPSIEGYEFDHYANALVKRFENTAIDHRCLQIAMDGSQKMPQRIFAPAHALIKVGKCISTFALATALWIKHIEGSSFRHNPIELNDPMANQLRMAIAAGARKPMEQIKAIGEVNGLETYGLFWLKDWCDAVAGYLELLNGRGQETSYQSDEGLNAIIKKLGSGLN